MWQTVVEKSVRWQEISNEPAHVCEYGAGQHRKSHFDPAQPGAALAQSSQYRPWPRIVRQRLVLVRSNCTVAAEGIAGHGRAESFDVVAGERGRNTAHFSSTAGTDGIGCSFLRRHDSH